MPPTVKKPQPPVKPSLRERIQAAAAKSAPSMFPASLDKPTPPPEKEVAVIPRLESMVPDKKASLDFARKAWRMGEISAQKAALAKEEKALKPWLKDMAGRFKISEALTGDWKLKYYSSPRSTVVEDKLVKALLRRGLQPDEIKAIVEESTSTTDGFTLKVSKIGTKEIEGEE